jgi:hypothetical protein
MTTFWLLLPTVAAQPFAVGNREVSLFDASRNREVPLLLYYPAQSEGSNVPLATGSFPLFTFGHGFLIPAASYANFAGLLAERGVVVALPSTEGSFAPNHDAFGKDIAFINTWYRSGQDNFFSCNGFSALGGHSMGGGASLLAASQTVANAYIGLAPALTNPSPVPGAPALELPAFVISGSVDNVTPPDVHHQPIWNALGSDCKVFASILGGNHCYYIPSSICDLGEIGSGVTLTRAEQQQTTDDLVWPFLQYWFGGSLSNWSAYLQDITLDNRVAIQETCSEVLSDKSESSRISIFPQPATEWLMIQGFDDKIQEAQLYDLQGRKVETEFATLEQSIQIRPVLPIEGLYVLQCRSGEQVYRYRVMFAR